MPSARRGGWKGGSIFIVAGHIHSQYSSNNVMIAEPGNLMATTQDSGRVDLFERWKGLNFRFLPIDERDVRILEKLAEDCRKPNTKIAKELGISEAAMRKRVKEMEEIGLIQGYSVKVDYSLMENSVKAYVSVKVDSEHRLKVVKMFTQHPRSLAVYRVTGDYDLLSVMLFRDPREFQEFADRHLKVEGGKSIKTHIVVSSYKGEIWSGA